MKLNKSTHYALHAALELAGAEGDPITTSQIASRYEMPEHAAAKVMQQLVRSGIAGASRGVGGGYWLARPASEVTVQDVIDLFEPRHVPTQGMQHALDDEQRAGQSDAAIRLHGLFEEVDETVRATFASVTLATLAG